MPTVDEIIGEKDLVRLFRAIVSGGGGETGIPNRHRVVRKIKTFGPLSVDDLEGLCDEDIMAELEGCRRWSILREIRRGGC